MLEKREKLLLKKVSAEVETAKEYTRKKNKRGMIYAVYLEIFSYHCNLIDNHLRKWFLIVGPWFNPAAAIQCLKRKRLYEQQIEQLGNFQLRIHDQVSFCCFYYRTMWLYLCAY